LDQYLDAKILIVDDDDDNLMILRRSFKRAGFENLETLSDPLQTVEAFHRFEPHLILLDLRMVPIDGFEVLERLRAEGHEDQTTPVLMLTGDSNPEVRDRALASHAMDFVIKSFDNSEVLLRAKNLLHTRSLYVELRRQKELLQHKVRERTRKLEESRRDLLLRLALAAEYRDDATGEHTRRVGNLSALIAYEMGLGEAWSEMLRQAAVLHDIGKIGIPDSILLKRGILTPDEFDTMKGHTLMGARLLSGTSGKLLRMASEIALTHHERWDGDGYPRGLSGRDIPLSGRIVNLADVFDALTNERTYKPAWTVADALREIESRAGHQFDPDVVCAFLAVSIRHELPVSSDFESPAVPHSAAVHLI
jgi:putative two-component system response regulator